MSHFSKEEYWKRRRNHVTMTVDGEKVRVHRPLRGQGVDTLEPVRTYAEAGTIMLGVQKFKREQSHRFSGDYNPKKKSVRGSVLRDLKEEAWAEWGRRHK